MRIFAVGVIGLIIGGLIGYFVSSMPGFKKGAASVVQNPFSESQPSEKTNVFSSQSASIQGKITKLDGDRLSITNSAGVSGEFGISPNAMVFKFRNATSQASPSSDLRTVELNKNVVVNLNFENDAYLVVSISQLPETTPSESGSNSRSR